MKYKKFLYFLLVTFLSINLTNPAFSADDEPGVSSQEILLGATYPQTGPVASYYSSYFSGANA
jgi:hypothetical protein